MDGGVEETFAAALGALAVTGVLWDVGDQAGIKNTLPIAGGIKAPIEVTRCAIIGRVLGAPYRACGTSTTPSFRRTRSPVHLCGNIMAGVHG